MIYDMVRSAVASAGFSFWGETVAAIMYAVCIGTIIGIACAFVVIYVMDRRN